MLCLQQILPSGDIYNVKRIGPSTKPWDTPDVRVVLGD